MRTSFLFLWSFNNGVRLPAQWSSHAARAASNRRRRSTTSLRATVGATHVAGRRCLRASPSSGKEAARPPLIVLGGMAQSVASWEFQLPSLCGDEREVLMYEGVGQGRPPPRDVATTTSPRDYLADVSLDRQGEVFWDVVDGAFPGAETVDVAGFSLGGRIAMAAAVRRPERVRRLHLTGVGADRDPLAEVHLTSWRESLGRSDRRAAETSTSSSSGRREGSESARLAAFAWAIILATYSETTLARAGPERIATWAKQVCENNTAEGLRAILEQTHDGEGPWTPREMARLIHSKKAVERTRLVVGSEDRISPRGQAEELAAILNGSEEESQCSFEVLEGCGHAAPMEAAKAWQSDVLRFLR